MPKQVHKAETKAVLKNSKNVMPSAKANQLKGKSVQAVKPKTASKVIAKAKIQQKVAAKGKPILSKVVQKGTTKVAKKVPTKKAE